MKQELINIIDRLKKDESRLLSVMDAETYRPIINSWSNGRISAKYGSVEEFFNNLVASGIGEIIIEERKKHGSSSIPMGEKIKFTLIKKNEPMHEDTTPSVSPQMILPATVTSAQTQIPLNGLAGFGLGLPQLMELHVSAHDKTRLETENKFYKEENERLKKEVADLKEERLENKFSEAKAKGNNEMLLGILANIPSLLGAFKSGASPVGLTGSMHPSETYSVPENKQYLFEKLSTTSHDVDNYLLAILNGIYTNQTFFVELEQILKKHQLISNE